MRRLWFISFQKKVAAMVLVMLCSILLIPNQTFANAYINDKKYSAQSTSLTQDGQPIIPLYPPLKWNTKIAKTQTLSLDRYPKPVDAAGLYFESETFYVSEKPPQKIFDYYSSNQMVNYKWERLGYLDKPNSIGIMYRHIKENRYMTVFIEACNNNDGNLFGLNSLPEHFYCVKIWVSEILPLSSQVQPSRPLSSKNFIPSAPLGINYDNPLPVPFYSQRGSDPSNSIVLGWGCDWVTIYNNGCSLTAHTMLYNYYQPGYTTVLLLNDSMKVAPGIYDCVDGCCNWWPLGTPDAPSGVSYGTRFTNVCGSVNCIDSNNVPVIDNEINSGRPLYLRVHTVEQGFNSHSIVLTGHSGSDYYINDPWSIDNTQLTLLIGAMGPYVVDYIDTINGGLCPGSSLQNPPDGYISTSQTVDFSWSAVSGCTFSGYTFRIKDSSNMDSGGNTIEDIGVVGTSRTATIDSQWNNMDLYWGIKAANAPSGANWSVRHFRMEPPTLTSFKVWLPLEMR